MFRMSLLNLISFVNIKFIKSNIDLSTFIKCFNEYFIFNVDLNMFLILIKRFQLKYYNKIILKFNGFIFILFYLFNK
jgi:hypothetical protein